MATTLRRFKMNFGGHFDLESALVNEDGTRTPMGVQNGETKIPNRQIHGGRGYEKGDVIETERDLNQQNGNPAGSQKFEEIFD